MLPECPHDALLTSFVAGDLPDADATLLAEHLDRCATCTRRLAEIEAASVSVPGRVAANEVWDFQRLAASAREVLPVPENSPFQLGKVVDKYRLIRVLGRGGMGVVYEAEHLAMPRRVAFKVLSNQRVSDPSFATRFANEIRIAGAVNNDHFVRSLDAGMHAGQPYLVMELLRGHSLDELVKRWGTLPLPEVCEIGRQLAEALGVLRELGFVHRDLKPGNVMLAWRQVDPTPATESADSTEWIGAPSVVVLDFGVARSLHGLTSQTTGSVILGTLEYMAPEQISGSAVGVGADSYSLGATLFKLLAGRAPLELLDASPEVKARRLTSFAAPSIRGLRPDLPRRVARIIDGLLALSPADRPAPDVVQKALQVFAKGADLRWLVEKIPSAPRPCPELALTGSSQRSQVWWGSCLILALGFCCWLGNARYFKRQGAVPIEVVAGSPTGGETPVAPPVAVARDIRPQIPGDNAARDEFRQQAQNLLSGDGDDANAEPWTRVQVSTPALTIAGNWYSRWKCRDPAHDGYHEGEATLQLSADDKISIRFQEPHVGRTPTSYLIAARRQDDWLVGTFQNLTPNKEFDASEWIGRVVSPYRIDGIWGQLRDGKWVLRRWDFRRLAPDEDRQWEYLAAPQFGLAGKFVGHKSHVSSLTVNAAEDRALSTGQDTREVILWNLNTGAVERVFQHHLSGRTRSAAFLSENMAASGASDGGIVFFDLTTGDVFDRLPDRQGSVMSLAAVPDHPDWIMSSGGDIGSGQNDIHIWDWSQAQIVKTFAGHTNMVYPALVSPDGTLIGSTCHDGTVRIWRIEDETQIRVWDVNAVNEVLAWFPDSRRIVAGAKDFGLTIYDVVTGEELSHIPSQESRPLRVAVSADGQRMLTTHGHDTNVYLWDASTGERIFRFAGNVNEVYSCALLKSGQFALVGGGSGNSGHLQDHALRLWRLPDNNPKIP